MIFEKRIKITQGAADAYVQGELDFYRKTVIYIHSIDFECDNWTLAANSLLHFQITNNSYAAVAYISDPAVAFSYRVNNGATAGGAWPSTFNFQFVKPIRITLPIGKLYFGFDTSAVGQISGHCRIRYSEGENEF